MSSPADQPERDDSQELKELRALLLGGEQQKIDRLERRLEDPEQRAKDVGSVLPDAIAQRSREDARLGAALTPTVEELLQQSVRRNPAAMAEAIFPILGPAIRRAISHAISGLVETINRTIEQTFTVTAMRWRLQAWRTGRPFSEIVLANIFVYRTEQVLLVHRDTGLLLCEVTAPELSATSPELVSAMLTAIQDFVRDSFSDESTGELDQVQVGELTLLLERGPQALACAAVRGNPPTDVRTSLQEALETIHTEKSSALIEFDGDASALEAIRPVLEGCLSEQRRPKKKSLVGVLVVGAAAIGLVALGAIWWLVESRHEQQWRGYLDALASEPGIDVVDSGERDGRRYVVGLKDPLAADPRQFAERAGLTEPVDTRWVDYLSSDETFVLSRAKQLLAPPSGATLELVAGDLRISGRATHSWLREARRLAALVPGVAQLDTGELELVYVDVEQLAIQEAAAEDVKIAFVPGSDHPSEPAQVAIATLRRQLRVLDQTAEGAGVSVIVTVIGAGDVGDDSGGDIKLGESRAQRIREALSTSRWLVTTFQEHGCSSGPGSEPSSVVVDARIHAEEGRR